MIRAVLDANVLDSGFPASSGTMAALIDFWRSGEINLVISQHIIDEVGRAWTKPYWRAGFSQEQVDRALSLLHQEADVTPITVHVAGIATHPEDDLVLATAVSAQVDYLATGDKHLQEIGNFQGVVILSPRALLELLTQDDRDSTRE